MTGAIEARGLSHRYGSVVALDGVDLSVPAGQILGLLGPNGAGKSTAIRILATLLRPDSGTATVAGHDVIQAADRVRRSIGLTGQFAAVDGELTAAENLRLIATLLDQPRRTVAQRTAELLADAGLSEFATRRAKTLSGGLRRRLDLAASLVGRPAVLFLDEPTTGLDPAARDGLWRTIRALTAAGTTVLLTTQYLAEADALADQIVVVDRGRVVATGTAPELKRRIGGRTLSVRPADPAMIPTVEQVVRVTVNGPVEVGGGTVRTAVVGEAELGAILPGLRAAGVALSEVLLQLPSLDDVFLRLTGHRTDPGSVSG